MTADGYYFNMGHDKISEYFFVVSGVWQGGILSHVLFTLFISFIIMRLKDCGT